MKLPIRTRRWEKHLSTLDEERDNQEIIITLSNHVFPVEVLLSVELAQLRTFTIPTISKTLHATRQYEDEGQRRLDDTRAILTELFTSPRGTGAHDEMVKHLNAIHGLYKISNDDYLYTLSTFIFDPWRFIEKYGHRPLSPKEKRAIYLFYRELGESMGMEDIPESFDAFLKWREDYERRVQRHTPENEAVASGMLRAVEQLLPRPLRPLVEPLISALIDEPAFEAAIGIQPAPEPLRAAVRNILLLRREVCKFISFFEEQALWEHPLYKTYKSYPDGYDRLKLGPEKVLAALEKRRASA
jgi:hypothetical protein